MSPVLEANISDKPVAYSHILALDGTIRDFYPPSELDMFGSDGLSEDTLPLRVQQIYVSCGRRDRSIFFSTRFQLLLILFCAVTLQLHRNYFTQAMNGPEPFYSHTSLCAIRRGDIYQCVSSDNNPRGHFRPNAEAV